MTRQRDDIIIKEKIQYSFCPNHRETMQALAKAKLNNSEFRIVIALMNQTDGYIREEDEISIRFWQTITLMGRQSIHCALRNLLSLKVIAQNGQRFKLNHPNLWSPEVFQPQRLPQQSISSAKTLLSKETKKKDYLWLARTLEKAAQMSLTSDVSEAGDKSTKAENKIETLEKTSLTSDATVTNQGRFRHQPVTLPSLTSDVLNVPKESTKEEKALKRSAVAPLKTELADSVDKKEQKRKPGWEETKLILDMIALHEGITFLDFPKLLGNVRPVFLASKATVEDWLLCYTRMREDTFWGGLSPSQVVLHLKEHLPVYLKLKAEGKLDEFLRSGNKRCSKPGQSPGAKSRFEGWQKLARGEEKTAGDIPECQRENEGNARLG